MKNINTHKSPNTTTKALTHIQPRPKTNIVSDVLSGFYGKPQEPAILDYKPFLPTICPVEFPDRAPGHQSQHPSDSESQKVQDGATKTKANSRPSTDAGQHSRQADGNIPQGAIPGMFDLGLRQLAINRGADWVHYVRDRQNAVYVIIPSNDSYVRFIDLCQNRLREVFHNYSVETTHNNFALALCDPEIYFQETSCRRAGQVCVSSDNETFTLMDGKNVVVNITFRPFGSNTVELSRMLVQPNYQKRGIGTDLVKLCQNVAKEFNARLVLYPATPMVAKDIDERTESRRLRKWYGELGFVNGPPEMFNGFRLVNNDPILFGWCGMMVFR